MTLALFVIIFSVLVLVHEFGHYISAIFLGITVEEFSIGFPPHLWSKTLANGTRFSIGSIPIGGYVKLEGEESPSSARSFASQSILKRCIVIISGVAMNVVLSVAIIVAVLMVNTPIPAGDALVQSVIITAERLWMVLEGIGSLLGRLIQGADVSREVIGPLGIGHLIGLSRSGGVLPLLDLIVMLSLNLAVINILPIPALDGGRLFFLLLSGVWNIPSRIERAIHQAGFIALIIILLMITANDLRSLLP